ncbi:MAG: hypothetical protein ACYC6A_10855 [Armatimonadota bacterium]
MTYPTRAKISLRIGTPFWREKAWRKSLLGTLRAYRDTIEEVAFFTSGTHPPLPLQTIRDLAAEASEILPEFRALGLSAGINHLSTIGHHNENLAYSLNEPWTKLTNIRGVVEEGNYCPNDPDFRQYVRDSYAALAQAKPDFLWVDDDVRLQGHGKVDQACFCDRCLAIFSAESGRSWTREQLCEAFIGGAPAERLAMRKLWLSHNRRTMRELLAHIRAAVDAVDPALPVGLMSGENFYSGFAYDEWARALAGAQGTPVMWRPGGGFYTDDWTGGLLAKTHSIGRQTAALPAAVAEVQSEIENFPYQRLKKAASTLALEVAAYIGAGCTGAALNCVGFVDADPQEYLPYFDAVRACRASLARAAGALGRRRTAGVWQALDRDEYATVRADGDWTTAPGWHGPIALAEWSEIGLPIAYGREGAAMTVLSGDSCLAFSREELYDMLAGGVLLDAPALWRLDALGLLEDTGFEVIGVREDDTIEQLTADPLNGPLAGAQRDCRQSFKWWSQTACLLRPLSAAARVLAEGVDYGGTSYGAVVGVYENPRGGRVAACGYFPWSYLQTRAKTIQMKALCRWLSRDALPAYVDSYHKIALWSRQDASGRPALLLANVSLDPAHQVRILVRDASPLTLTRMDGSEEPLSPAGSDGPYTVFDIPRLGAWQAAMLTS